LSFFTSLRCIALLIGSGACLDGAAKNGNTPLHCAAANDNFDAVKLLSGSGAVVSRKNSEGKSVSQLGRLETSKLILELLKRKGISEEASGNNMDFLHLIV